VIFGCQPFCKNNFPAAAAAAAANAAIGARQRSNRSARKLPRRKKIALFAGRERDSRRRCANRIANGDARRGHAAEQKQSRRAAAAQRRKSAVAVVDLAKVRGFLSARGAADSFGGDSIGAFERRDQASAAASAVAKVSRSAADFVSVVQSKSTLSMPA
jgi:hypothetical protein